MDILLKDLAAGQNYVLQVRAKSSDGQYSAWSTAYNLLTVSDTTPPAPITSLSWTVSGSSFIGTWTAPTLDANGLTLKDLQDYQITVTANSISSVFYVTETIFNLSLSDNISFFSTPQPSVIISVKARDTSGNLSTAVSTSISNAVPANVAGLTATPITSGIQLSWTANSDTDIKQYEVYASTTNGFTPSGANLVYTGLNTSYVYPSTTQTTYYFKVRAVDLFNQGSTSYASTSAVPDIPGSIDTTAPGVPGSVTVSTASMSDGTSSVTVSWAAVSSTNLRQYMIRYSTDQTNWQYSTVPSTQTSLLITGLLPNTTYYVGVCSVSYNNIKSNFGNAATYPITSAADTTAPSQPSAPTVSTGTLVAQVSHAMTKQAGGNLESDVLYIEVHASTTTGFTPSSSTLRGTLNSAGPGITVSGAFYFDATTSIANLYWKVIAVDKTGNKSTASNQTTGLPGLIQSVNILDATITDAKIQNLSAAKLVAGTAFVNDLSVQSNLTINASGGHIKSSNYNAGSQTGWTLDQTGLTIYDGTIFAKSLQIQDSNNICPVAFADFEFFATYYRNSSNVVNTGNASADSGVLLDILTTGMNTNKQCLRIYNTSLTFGSSHKLFFAPSGLSTTDVNVVVQPGDYIFSLYAKKNGTPTQFVKLSAYTDAAASIQVASQTISSTSYVQFYGTITVPSGVNKLKLYLEFGPNSGSTGYDFVIDSVQFERKLGGLTTPSPWTPPSSTSIDGGSIVTGSIKSSATASGISTQPAWSFDTAGNAQMGNALIRGILTVGAGADLTTSYVQSSGYSAGSSGWIIKGDGTVEFNNATVRGTIKAGGNGNAGVINVYNSSNGLIGSIDNSGIKAIGSGGSIYINPNITYPAINFDMGAGTDGIITAGADGSGNAQISVNGSLWTSGGTSRYPRMYMYQDNTFFGMVNSSTQADNGGQVNITATFSEIVFGNNDASPNVYNGIRATSTKVQTSSFLYYSPAFTDETWHTPTLSNSWIADVNSPPIGYKLLPHGFVALRGAALSGTNTDGTVIFTLPTGYRPEANSLFVCAIPASTNKARVQVASNGQVTVYDLGSSTAISFAGLQFPLPTSTIP